MRLSYVVTFKAALYSRRGAVEVVILVVAWEPARKGDSWQEGPEAIPIGRDGVAAMPASGKQRNLYGTAIAFNNHPCAALHQEIRLAQKDYGLTPLDRRRLEWQIEETDKKVAEGEKRRRPVEVVNAQDDPLSI